MAIGFDIALHHFKAPATIRSGRASSAWLMENGVPFRRALGEVSIHWALSLARASSGRTLLENVAVVGASEWFFYACRVRLILHAA